MSKPAVTPLFPLNLRAIYIRESETKIDPDFDPLVPGQQLVGQSKFSSQAYTVVSEKATKDASPIAQSCAFTTKFEFLYRLGDGSDPGPTADLSQLKLAATISVSIAADYAIAPGSQKLDKEFLSLWGQSTVLTHVWPYWREYCHSTMTRMNLPLMLVPLMVQQTVKAEKAAHKTRARPKK